MSLKKKWRIFKNYTLPHFFIKHVRHEKASEKGYEFFIYLLKNIENPDYEPETYQEELFNQQVDEFSQKEGYTREETIALYFRVLLPYLDIEFLEDGKCGMIVKREE